MLEMSLNNLNVKKVRSFSSPGMYSDGNGLYLRVGPTGGRSWILRTVVHGRRRELGLGSAILVSLAEAREQARVLRKIAREGGNPDSIRKRQSFTFEEATRKVHVNLLPTWRNPKHGKIWISSMENHVFPIIGTRPLDTISTTDVLDVLSPIWTETHDTARRIKQRIAVVFDWAKGAGHYTGENPVNGIKKALPTVKRRVTHMASMSWQELPEFMQSLKERSGVSARCLEFLILTCVRSGEARGARWSEIEGGVWTIPADRMKGGVTHRIPLTDDALALLDDVRGLDPELIFPSLQSGKQGKAKEQSVNVFKALFKRMKREGFTTHGFRSTFRDWCSESARADRELAEAALAHTTGNAVERAYARSDLFERRRGLMESWSRYANKKDGATIQLVHT